MGLDIDVLTTEDGCRKREAINVRSNRSKTAGMLFTYRSVVSFDVYLDLTLFILQHLISLFNQ